MRKVFLNGKFVAESDAKLSIYDSALMFGDMVFEMTRSFNKIQFKLREHLERLYMSARYLRIDVPISIDDMQDIVYETIRQNEPSFEYNDEHRVLINISRGILPIYKNNIDHDHFDTNIVVADFPLRWTVTGMDKLFDHGINAVITSQRTIPATLLEPKVKNRSRIHYMLANLQAADAKGRNNWALLLDPDGFVAEGTGSNFFIVKNNKLVTPEGRNILRGISRGYVMELAWSLNIPVEEKNIEPYDVLEADEAFMTGTPFCMIPVSSINGQQIGNVAMGRITKLLLDQWSTNVGINIVKQIQDWSK